MTRTEGRTKMLSRRSYEDKLSGDAPHFVVSHPAFGEWILGIRPGQNPQEVVEGFLTKVRAIYTQEELALSPARWSQVWMNPEEVANSMVCMGGKQGDLALALAEDGAS